MLESAAMNFVTRGPLLSLASAFRARTVAVLLAIGGAGFALPPMTACSPTLVQPYYGMKNQPITIHRLQNYEPQAAQAGIPQIPGAPAIPPQIQQWLNGAGSLLPPGLIPPGLLPGSQAQPAAADATRFYGFRILQTMQVTDPKMRDEILELFGRESSFQTPRQSCMYPEVGFSIGQAGGAVQGAPASGPPADVLVSLSCEQADLKTYGWPFGTKNGLTSDSSAKVMEIFRKSFGG
jgi:hypothetical protein